MPGLLADVDPDGLLEYSVVYTDRTLNHMSVKFQVAMRALISGFKELFQAEAAIFLPGSGTFAMEAVARHFATGKRCTVIRNGFFSFRWSQILEQGGITGGKPITVLTAARDTPGKQEPFAPVSLAQFTAAVNAETPDVVFAPHVETSSGVLLTDDYIRDAAAAVHAANPSSIFVLDCIASGALWVDMKALGVDVIVTAPQKGFSGPAGAGIVLLGARAAEQLAKTTSTSFALDLNKWRAIMTAYENGGFAYHTTMPTDALFKLHRVFEELKTVGFDAVKAAQLDLGAKVRAMLEERGFTSVAAAGFRSPTVVVSYTADEDIKNGKKFAAAGMQIAAGVPLQCNEGADFTTFRVGLFGLDKLADVDATVARLRAALDRVLVPSSSL